MVIDGKKGWEWFMTINWWVWCWIVDALMMVIWWQRWVAIVYRLCSGLTVLVRWWMQSKYATSMVVADQMMEKWWQNEEWLEQYWSAKFGQYCTDGRLCLTMVGWCLIIVKRFIFMPNTSVMMSTTMPIIRGHPLSRSWTIIQHFFTRPQWSRRGILTSSTHS